MLDYFAAQRTLVEASRLVFRYEASMDFAEGEALLLRQLCLHTAFPTEPASSLLPAYLSGESRLVLENYPELGFFRDIVFIFKLLMVPSSEALPEIYSWLPLDAALTWRYSAAGTPAADRPRRVLLTIAAAALTVPRSRCLSCEQRAFS